MEQEILDILREINPYITVDTTTRLIEEDILDSMGILVLITELESKYHITVPLEKLKIAYFETVAAVVEFVSHCIAEQK